MKSFLFVCLFAAASAAPAADADAEADPALLYSSYYPHTYTYGAVPAVHHTTAVKSIVHTPAKVEVKSVSPVVYNTGVVHHNPVVYNAGVHTPVVYNTTAAVHTPVVHSVQTPVVAKAAGYYANSGGAVHVVKREADAEADAEAEAYYNLYGYYPSARYVSPYTRTYTPYAYRSTYPYGYYY